MKVGDTVKSNQKKDGREWKVVGELGGGYLKLKHHDKFMNDHYENLSEVRRGK